ncbi:MAG: hypothetical protein R3B48_05410 [Kofleriaceae bacterium]
MQDKLSKGPEIALGVPPGASPGEVRAAFMALTKLYHPAKFARLDDATIRLANEVFLSLREAYAALQGPPRRAGTENDGRAHQRGLTPPAAPARPVNGRLSTASDVRDERGGYLGGAAREPGRAAPSTEPRGTFARPTTSAREDRPGSEPRPAAAERVEVPRGHAIPRVATLPDRTGADARSASTRPSSSVIPQEPRPGDYGTRASSRDLGRDGGTNGAGTARPSTDVRASTSADARGPGVRASTSDEARGPGTSTSARDDLRTAGEYGHRPAARDLGPSSGSDGRPAAGRVPRDARDGDRRDDRRPSGAPAAPAAARGPSAGSGYAIPRVREAAGGRRPILAEGSTRRDDSRSTRTTRDRDRDRKRTPSTGSERGKGPRTRTPGRRTTAPRTAPPAARTTGAPQVRFAAPAGVTRARGAESHPEHRRVAELIARSRWQEALQVLQGLLAREPQEQSHLAQVAYVHAREAMQLGNVSAARRELERALTLHPGLDCAARALAELERSGGAPRR